MADIKKEYIYAVGADNGASGEIINATAGNTYYVPMQREQGMGLAVISDSGATLTLKAGTEYKKSLGDNVISLPAGKGVVIPLYDSARYKIGKGDHAGSFAFTTSAAVDVIPFVI